MRDYGAIILIFTTDCICIDVEFQHQRHVTSETRSFVRVSVTKAQLKSLAKFSDQLVVSLQQL